MRIRWRSVLALLAMVAAVAAFIMLKPSEDSAPRDDAEPSAPADSPHPPAAPQQDASDRQEDVPEDVRAFISKYGAPSLDEVEWADSLKPYTTPALWASLLTSERELARNAGTAILEAEDGRVSVGVGSEVIYVLEYTAVDGGHEHDAEESAERWIVTAVDFMSPPAGAALPLGTDGVEQLRIPVQSALTTVIAQPGGLTDEQRQSLIEETFSHPEEALLIPRIAGEDAAIRIGNAHELVPAEEEGQLVVYATVPYAADGSSTPEWVTVTVLLGRDTDGQWVPQDARL